MNQRMIGSRRFRCQHIQSRSQQSACLQSLSQCSLIHKASSSRIDQNGSLLHLCQTGCIHHLRSLLVQRTMKRYHIRRSKQFIQPHLMIACRQSRFRFAGIHRYLHAKGSCQTCRRRPGTSESDNTDTLSGQFDYRCIPVAEIRLVTPYVVTYLSRIMSYLLRKVQDMGKDHLGNRLCTVSRHIRHDNPLFGSSLNVYNIISRCQYPDVFQFRKLLHHLTVYHTLVCQQHLSLPCTLYDICLLRPVIYHRFSQFIQCPPVVTVANP